MTEKTTPAVGAHALSKWYGQVAGLLNVDLEIHSGVVGLLGPNGAGKTTFMRLLTAQLLPSSGTMTLFGEKVWDNPEPLRRLGYCPEHDGMWEEMTGTELVELCLKLSGAPSSQASSLAAEAVAAVDMSESAGRRLKTYSKGMRQRIKLAQAIAHHPEVLVLDEPLTGCDPVARASIIELVRKLGEQATTILVSSHVLHEVEAMTDQIVLINKGQVLAQGNIHKLRELIDEHPHRIRIVCDQPRKLAQTLSGSESVRSLTIDDDGLTVETPQPDSCYPEVGRAALDLGVSIRKMTSPDDNLDAVFRYLTTETQKAKEG